MKKDELVQVVRDYVNNDKAKYAVLITGDWGIGKTFFYENYLKDKIVGAGNKSNNKKTNVYISLYGISSIEQLSKEIIINYFIKGKLHRSDKNSKIYRQIGSIIGVFSKMFSFTYNGFTLDFASGYTGIENGIDFKDMIICLDDFERCNIQVNELFGLINNLVEHCNCKVIILADENNIGKIYANTNVEMKYLTLLIGRKLCVDGKNDECIGSGTQSIKQNTIETLKKLNEEVYSENYIYRDIKEKVIGLTLKYESNVRDDFKAIIESVITSEGLLEKLLENKEEILECMDKCRTNNIRIMKIWLMNFEKIYKVIDWRIKNSDDAKKYFNDIFNRFAQYSIRVACALGKNNSLSEWDNVNEIGNISLDDGFLMGGQGYKFVDELYKDSILNEQKLLLAINFIIRERKQEEEKEIDSHRREAYDKLNNRLYFLEDKVIDECIIKMKEEIERDEFKPQNYQNIIALLIILKQEECIDVKFINEICFMLVNKLENMKGVIDIENVHFDFSCQESVDLFHKFYKPLYLMMMEKNQQIGELRKAQRFSFSNGTDFLLLCSYPPGNSIGYEASISNFDLEKLVSVIQTGDIKEIYDIANGIEKLSVRTGDLEVFNMLVKKLNDISFDGRMRNKAVKYLIVVIHKKTNTIANSDKDEVNN